IFCVRSTKCGIGTRELPPERLLVQDDLPVNDLGQLRLVLATIGLVGGVPPPRGMPCSSGNEIVENATRGDQDPSVLTVNAPRLNPNRKILSPGHVHPRQFGVELLDVATQSPASGA